MHAHRLGRAAHAMPDDHPLEATLTVGVDHLAVDPNPDVPDAFDLFREVWCHGDVDPAAQHDRHIPSVSGHGQGGRPG